MDIHCLLEPLKLKSIYGHNSKLTLETPANTGHRTKKFNQLWFTIGIKNRYKTTISTYTTYKNLYFYKIILIFCLGYNYKSIGYGRQCSHLQQLVPFSSPYFWRRSQSIAYAWRLCRIVKLDVYTKYAFILCTLNGGNIVTNNSPAGSLQTKQCYTTFSNYST